MVDLQTHLYKIKEAEWELSHAKSKRRKNDLLKYIHRLHKERSECMKYLKSGTMNQKS